MGEVVIDDLVKAMTAKRALMGLSQRELAKRLGVAWSAVANWEKGAHAPGQLGRLKIRRWLEQDGSEPVPPAALLREETLAQVARRVDRLERDIVKMQREIGASATLPCVSGVGEPGGVSAPVSGEPLREVHEDPVRDGRGGGGAAAVRAPTDW